MNILLLDNYDSFTYNLVHMIDDLGCQCEVFRNDKISLPDVDRFDRIVLSPGPGIPDEAGIMKDLIRRYGPSKKILGVCLGHQAIAEVYGATLFNLSSVLHGVTSEVTAAADVRLFDGMPQAFTATHYHSWAVDPTSMGKNLRTIATSGGGMVMALQHANYDITGLQFHPESILTSCGKQIMKNWLSY